MIAGEPALLPRLSKVKLERTSSWSH